MLVGGLGKDCAGLIGYHAIFGMYGFWLPNDPRGSWSTWVGAWDLYLHGKATKVDGRVSLAKKPHDVGLRLRAKGALKYRPVVLDGRQALVVGRGFEKACREHGHVVRACAIMPDHVHLVIDQGELKPGYVIGQFKRCATEMLLEAGIHPMQDVLVDGKAAACFTRGGWKVYLDEEKDVFRAMRYVDENPLKEGLKGQRWGFVTGV